MKILLSIVLVCCLAAPAYATHRRQVVIQQGGLIVTPFAVPVALPVTQLQNPAVLYGYQQSAAAYRQQSLAQFKTLEERIVDLLMLRLSKLEGTPFSTMVEQTLVHQHCIKCHGGEKPKGDFSLSGELTAPKRLRMIQRITHPNAKKRMPKGRVLNDILIGDLIQELSVFSADAHVGTFDMKQNKWKPNPNHPEGKTGVVPLPPPIPKQ